jgi:predicted GNAT superfamily acetyltransferase
MSEQQTAQAEESRAEIVVRDCTTMAEYDQCIALQREAFALPDLEISPRRHLIVTRRAGGWTLGAFVNDEMVGFVHHMIAVRGENEIIGYSHMMAVAKDYQNKGVGAKLKWAQRERALSEGRNFIKWTWDPMQARNAHFNLNRLGVIVRSYGVNFYGTDYITMPHGTDGSVHLDSDRLFADWQLDSRRVELLAEGRDTGTDSVPDATIEIPPDWSSLMSNDPSAARREQLRVRAEFETAFRAGLICAGFARDKAHPRYLLYKSDE